MYTIDKIILKLQFRQPIFTYSNCGLFTKHRYRIWNFKQSGDIKYICQNESWEVCFSYELVYFDSKNFYFISDNTLIDTIYDIAMNSDYDKGTKDDQVLPLVLWQNRMSDILAQELHKAEVKKFRRRNVYVTFTWKEVKLIWNCCLLITRIFNIYWK